MPFKGFRYGFLLAIGHAPNIYLGEIALLVFLLLNTNIFSHLWYSCSVVIFFQCSQNPKMMLIFHFKLVVAVQCTLVYRHGV
jgi:hypothetical protein